MIIAPSIPEDISRTLALLMQSDNVIEMRAPKTKWGTVSGYYDNLDSATAAVPQLNGQVPAVYATINPVHPDLLARAKNRLQRWAKEMTRDHEVLCRSLFLIDIDPRRPAGISSTEREHAAALCCAEQCRDWLRQFGWPEPLFADSGNGAHLLYRIDLPNDSQSDELVRKCLQAVAIHFTDDTVEVDRKVHNAARITKVYGTLVAKGDTTEDRPHRLSRLIEVPSRLDIVEPQLLHSLASRIVAGTRVKRTRGKFDLDVWIAEHDLPVVETKSWNGAGRRFILNPCPWNSEHQNKAAFIVQFEHGAIAAGCHHKGCAHNDWNSLRELFEGRSRFGGNRAPDREHGSRGHAEDNGSDPITINRDERIDFFGTDTTRREEVIEGVFREGQLCTLAGPFGVGKSPALCQLTVCLTKDVAFCGRKTVQRPVIVFDFESAPPDYKRNITNIAERLKVSLPSVPDELEIYMEHDRADSPYTAALLQLVQCSMSDKIEFLHELLVRKPTALIIMDPVEMLFGIDTTRKKEVLELYRELRRGLLAKFPHSMMLLIFNMRKNIKKGPLPDLLQHPRPWMEEVCGTLDIANRADVRLGMDFYQEELKVINGIRRGEDMHPLILQIEGEPPDHLSGFGLCKPSAFSLPQIFTPAQYKYWEKLPQTLVFEEMADTVVPRATLWRLLERAKSVGLIQRGDDGLWRKNE